MSQPLAVARPVQHATTSTCEPPRQPEGFPLKWASPHAPTQFVFGLIAILLVIYWWYGTYRDSKKDDE